MSRTNFHSSSSLIAKHSSNSTRTKKSQMEANSIVINDVRITPSQMIFNDAYDGKHFKQKLTIHNCGSRSVFVRLLDANSATFKYKSFPSGLHLSPGMKFIRYVKYAFSRVFEVLEGFTSIWINETEVKYDFLVLLSASIVSVDPPVVDFGQIDAVSHAISRIFYIKNTGKKGCLFAIDLGVNPLEISVDPPKGILPAKSAVPVKVEIVGTTEGEFTEELWIKTKPPQRVIITGVFISPKLLVRKFIHSLDFTLVDFPPTYCGSTSTQTLLVRNFSSSHSMFCIRAEIKGTTMTLDEARKIDSNFSNFIINPIDGRIAALKGVVIEITFSPMLTGVQLYAACFLKVIRMKYRDTDSSEITEVLHTTKLRSDSETSTHMPSTSNFTIWDRWTSSAASLLNDDKDFPGDHNISSEYSIGVCLHGVKTVAAITLRPTQLVLKDLTLEQVYNRELLVTNESFDLPIRVKYNKVASIDIHPQCFDIDCGGSLEVLVTIRASKLDLEGKQITFDLLAQSSDVHTKNSEFRKVGNMKMDIIYETTIVVKKPRLNQCVVCTDVVPKLSQDFPYRLDSTELMKKVQENNYYLQYIRSLKKKPADYGGMEDYDVIRDEMSKKKDLCFNLKARLRKDQQITALIPLPPSLLYNIKITPEAIRLQKVTAFTTISDFLEIENLNDFKISVFLKASKTSLVFENNSRYIIGKKEKKRIYFSFSTSQTGRYYINISILINMSTLYEVTAVANVVPKTLKLDMKKIEFGENDGQYKFFRLINALNSFASFDWEVPESCFRIYPVEGGIKAESSMMLCVMYNLDSSQQNNVECVLTSESGEKRTLALMVKKRRHLVVFDSYCVDFGMVPLNTPVRKKITLQNLKNFQVLFSVLNGSYIPGITVEPEEGILRGLDSQVFIINIHLKAILEFNIQLLFNIDNEEEISIGLQGTVDYPQFSFKPDTLQFRMISPNSFDILAFKVTNVSQCEARVTFPTEDLQEFTITESEEESYQHLSNMMLEPNQTKILYLHFHPNYVSTYSLYLPYIINDIMGPVYLNSNQTSFSNYFFKEFCPQYEKIEGVVVKKTPQILSTIRINCRAISKSLEFSNLVLNMCYYGPDHPSNQTTRDFEITNTSQDVVDICIRTDDLQFPFSLDPKDDAQIEFYEVSYKITLEAGEKVTFEATFSPEEVGEYAIKLPIFLRHYFDDKIFNFLNLKGVYGVPTMVPSINCLYFEPLPLGTTNEASFELHMQHHFDVCDLFVEGDPPGLLVDFDKVSSNKVDTTYRVVICYECSETQCYDCEVSFQCSCNSVCSVHIVAVAETCLLTTHVFCNSMIHGIFSEKKKSKNVELFGDAPTYGHLLINKNTTCFPLFPSDDDDSWYGKYMRNVLTSVENWIFSQCFFLKNYYRIPEGFSDFSKVKEPAKKMVFGGLKKPKLVDLPLLELITNIAGAHVRTKLAPSYPTEQDDMAWLRYTCMANCNVLSYLRNLPVYLPHVKSKFLLNYDQYLKYEKIKQHNQNPIEESIFYRRSKQCWLDLILQIIKVFFLYRSVPALIYTTEKPESLRKQRQRYSLTEITRSQEDINYEKIVDVNVFGPHEKELIHWLKSCYDQEKLKLWPSSLPALKDWIFIDEDLKDSVVLGAVTAHYCPYVASEIRQMCSSPFSSEEFFHNRCILVKIWQSLGFSYVISPLELEHMGLVEIILLLVYLYEVLPHHLPKEEVVIKAPLTQSNYTVLHLENLGDYHIYYKTIFFNNHNDLFRVAKETLHVEPRGGKTVKVFYHAKTVQTAVTTLLFSGETPGNKYGKTVVVKLMGVADVSYSNMTIPLTVDLYKICNVVLHVESPFKVKTDYSLSFSYEQASRKSHQMFPWEEIRRLRMPKEFFLQDEKYQFDEGGLCSINLTFCCQYQGPRDMWFYFTNPEVGDWGIQVTVTGRITQACSETIEVPLPEHYNQLVCRCKHKFSLTTNCPVILYVQIPKQNNLLWKARKAMVLHNVEGEEFNFWSKRIYTPTGTRILKLLFNSETHPMRKVIEDSMEYEVRLEKPKAFVTLGKVLIDDIISDGFYTLPIHPVQDLAKLKKCNMKFVAVDDSETRFYKLLFVRSNLESQSVIEDVGQTGV